MAGLFRVFAAGLAKLAEMPRPYRRALTVGMDAVLCALSGVLSLYLRTNNFFWLGQPLLILLGISLTCWFIIALIRDVYSSLVRSSGPRTILALAATILVYTIPMVAILMVLGISGVPRTMGFLQPIVFLGMLTFSRMIGHYLLIEFLGQRRDPLVRRRIAIYGAGRAGQQLANALRHESHMELIAFFDDDDRLNRQVLDGVVVIANRDPTVRIEELSLDEVLLAIPSASRSRRRQIVEDLTVKGIQVRSLPSMGSIIDGKVQVSDLRRVRVEDLLGREPNPPDIGMLEKNIADRTVMVTGAGGSIGSELCRQIVGCRPAKLVLVENSEFALYEIESELRDWAAKERVEVKIEALLCDVSGKQAIERAIEGHGPQTVFHAAAYKHVPLLEHNPLSGVYNNVFGTLHTVLAAEKAGVQNFILISTDKAVRPTNVMGATKRICETILQARAAHGSQVRLSMVRFGNVLGSSGSVVPKFRKQIGEGGPITLTDRRVTRYFMTIREAAQLVIQAGAMARGGEVFFLEMGKPVKIYDLAVSMIHLSGLTLRSDESPHGDIEIREIGLRPGEKLYEELLIGKRPQKTSHERIVKAYEDHPRWEELSRVLEDLNRLIGVGDTAGVLATIGHMVPEYAPNTSGAEPDIPLEVAGRQHQQVVQGQIGC